MSVARSTPWRSMLPNPHTSRPFASRGPRLFSPVARGVAAVTSTERQRCSASPLASSGCRRSTRTPTCASVTAVTLAALPLTADACRGVWSPLR